MFELRRLVPSDLQLIQDFQERIYEHLEDKALFQRSSAEFISYCLGEGGLCYAVFHDGTPVAYRMVYFPKDRPNNLALDLDLPPEEKPFVAHWDTVAVDPAWRGHGLSYKMNQVALADLENYDIRHLCSTTSPFNPYGLNSLLKIGFRVRALKEKYGGKLRFICHRLFRPTDPPHHDAASARDVPLSDIEALRAALAQGCAGVSTHQALEGIALRFYAMRPIMDLLERTVEGVSSP